MTTTYFSLCRGADIRLCKTCLRHADHNPAASADPHQPFIAPQTSGERCTTWKPLPAAATPRIDTGD